jgi:predicted kinase
MRVVDHRFNLNQKEMKELILLRGLPGSGKSTLAKSISDCYFEADMWFVQEDGTYKFDPLEIKKAHEWCQTIVNGKMSIGVSKVVVSNTFTQEWEMKPYYELAKVWVCSILTNC